MKRLVILAPNWLGDAVMALPAIADVHRGSSGATISVAARPAIAPLFRFVPGVASVVTLERRGWRRLGADLAAGNFDTALLLPNSMHAALVARRAGIRERWGYRTDWRSPLLTKAIHPPSGLHQAEYYQQLVHALGFSNGSVVPHLPVSATVRKNAAALLRQSGWDGKSPIVAIAPGAAFGGAKRWPPERFGLLATDLATDGVATVMVGSAADRPTANDVLAAESRVVDLVGKTDLAALTGVLAAARTLVTNDSGAMHLAAAVGTRVTALFGPTDDCATRPLGDGHDVIIGPAWCRPCMLRECPLDHRCMRGIDAAAVTAAARRTL